MENRLVVYHGTQHEFSIPDLKKSREDIDFGAGFYLTTNKQMSQKWASTKKTAIVNEYRLDIEGLKMYHFRLDEEWLEYVIKNREGFSDDKYNQYDVLIGAVADDKLFDTIEEYQSGYLTKKEAIYLLNIGGFSEQIVLKTEKSVQHLEYVGREYLSEELKISIRNERKNEKRNILVMMDKIKKEWKKQKEDIQIAELGDDGFGL